MEEYKERAVWGVWWFLERDDEAIEDVSYFIACDEKEAVELWEKWKKLSDIPEGAKIICISRA